MKVTPFENDCGLCFSGTAFKIPCERWEVRRLVDEMQRHINRWDKKQAPAMPEPMREDPEESLYCLGENLIKAAYKYWQKYQKEFGPDAVVYLKDTSGHMVLFTRGEYSNIIMKNIENLSNEKPLNDPFTVEALLVE
jgi:hypothetical protein